MYRIGFTGMSFDFVFFSFFLIFISFPRERKTYVSIAIIIPSPCPQVISLVPKEESLRDPPVAQGGVSILVLGDRVHHLLTPCPVPFIPSKISRKC